MLAEATLKNQHNNSHQDESVVEDKPLALINGAAMLALPQDLYIPPEALEVFLEAFEGPLDLLLYLIRKQNLNILDICVAEITRQYVEYIELMQLLNIELAGEYLLMAATLAEIKSRSLLPKSSNAEEEEDPRAELIRRLQEYERFKTAAENLEHVPRVERDFFLSNVEPVLNRDQPLPDVNFRDVLLAFSRVLKRADLLEHHHIQREQLSTRERMSTILSRLKNAEFVSFESLFSLKEGRLGVVVTFLAMMELIKESLIDIVQTEIFGPIHLQSRGV